MKKYKGKITIGIIAAILVLVGVMAWQGYAADNWDARTFRLPFDGATVKVIVLRDYATGYIINATTGASAVDTAWDDGELTAVLDTITNDYEFAIPAIGKEIKTAYYTYYDNTAAASITKAVTPSGKPLLLDLATLDTYSSTNPIQTGLTGAAVRTREY